MKSGMQHPPYGGRYKRPCFHSDEGTWEGELEGEAIQMEGGNIPLLWRGVQKVSLVWIAHYTTCPSLFHLVTIVLPPSLPLLVAAPIGVVRGW